MRATLLALAMLVAACGGGGSRGVTGGLGFTVHFQEADFPTLQDYQDNAMVQRLLSRAGLTVHTGSNPPDVEGMYDVSQTAYINEVPPHSLGTGSFGLTLFDQSNGFISVDDSTSMADAFITGDGDDFTIWIVASRDIPGSDCTGVEVDLITGRVLPNGDLDVRLGAVTVGWFGLDCGPLLATIGFNSVDDALGLVIAARIDAARIGP